MAKLSPRERVLNMLKSTRAARPEDEEEDDEPGAPSQEDREKAAAPTESAPPPSDGDGVPPKPGTPPPGDGDGDEGEGEEEGDGDGDGDEEEGDGKPPMLQQKMPVGKPPMKKSLSDISDEEMRQELLRRSEETPEFMKSLYAMPEAEQLLQAIDMSPAVALIVHKASEQVAALMAEKATILKGLPALGDLLKSIQDDNAAILLGLAKSLTQQDQIIKSMDAVGGDLALIKSQDNGKVSHGTGQARTPQRHEPADAPQTPPGDEEVYTGPGKSPLLRGLMKAISAGDISKSEGETLMGLIDGSTGPAGVWKKMKDKGLEKHVNK